jgi:glycosyltransferase involved in cell wall biosynthesis
MVIVQLTTDNREPFRQYDKKVPWFGAAPEALLQGFADLSGVEIHVVSCTQQPMESPEKLAKNIWFHSLHVSKWGWMRTGYQGCVRAARKKIKEIKPDIVHGQGTERDCAISAVFSGFPNVITIHGNMAELARLFQARPGSFAWLAARLENFTLKKAAGVFCNSAYTEGLVRSRAPRTWRVPNAIRRDFFSTPIHERKSEKCIILNVGVISERKRQLELLELAARLHRKGVAAEFHFIGQADERSEYSKKFLEQIKLGETAVYAKFLGTKTTTELIDCYDHASALIHFPTEEAFGLVVAEALARNLKFFGAQLGGIIDIASGVPGAELFSMNDWDGLEQSIIQWIKAGNSKPPGAAEFMEKEYNPHQIALKHVEIYREVLNTAS